MIIRVHIFISGRVQGVAFRYFTQGVANSLGITGWVKNLDDGRVEIIAEGSSDKIEEFIKLVKKGPSNAVVSRFQVGSEKPSGEFKSFDVI